MRQARRWYFFPHWPGICWAACRGRCGSRPRRRAPAVVGMQQPGLCSRSSKRSEAVACPAVCITKRAIQGGPVQWVACFHGLFLPRAPCSVAFAWPRHPSVWHGHSPTACALQGLANEIVLFSVRAFSGCVLAVRLAFVPLPLRWLSCSSLHGRIRAECVLHRALAPDNYTSCCVCLRQNASSASAWSWRRPLTCLQCCWALLFAGARSRHMFLCPACIDRAHPCSYMILTDLPLDRSHVRRDSLESRECGTPKV